MRRGLRGSFLRLGLSAALGIGASAQAACPPADTSPAQWEQWRAGGFAKQESAQAQRLAPLLLNCLAHPDPHWRDGVAYEALQAWMRAGRLEPAEVRALGERLTAMLTAPDPNGFARPFAVLVLAEVARVDRTAGIWTDAQRLASLEAATAYMHQLRDYRGFEPLAGWRHGVAHAADALMQWTLNPKLSRAELDLVLTALASQVVAHGGHAYVHGESQRLARPVLFAAGRLLHSAQDWSNWLNALVPGTVPPAAPASLESLAARHNRHAFLMALYVSSQESAGSEWAQRLLPAVRAALRRLPPG